MRSSWLICFSGFLSIGLACACHAQTAEDFALLKKVAAATQGASTSRITSTVTDRDSGAVVETATIERVAPGLVHVVTAHHGKPGSEMISDGKRNLRRAGPHEPWKPFPANIGKMFQAPLTFSEDDMREEHIHLQPAGDDQVDGTPAKAYEMTSNDMTSKVWLAADNFRLLKVERDYDGAGPIDAPKFNGDLKSLQAQLKAATTQHHLHSLSVYSYDPSIKITMPPQ